MKGYDRDSLRWSTQIRLYWFQKVPTPTKQTILQWQMFKILDKFKSTATGFDLLPAWFLRLGAPLFARQLAGLLNLSITSFVPHQWNQANIRPIPKMSSPARLLDFRPISITSVLSRITIRIVFLNVLYPEFNAQPPPGISITISFPSVQQDQEQLHQWPSSTRLPIYWPLINTL